MWALCACQGWFTVLLWLCATCRESPPVYRDICTERLLNTANTMCCDRVCWCSLFYEHILCTFYTQCICQMCLSWLKCIVSLYTIMYFMIMYYTGVKQGQCSNTMCVSRLLLMEMQYLRRVEGVRKLELQLIPSDIGWSKQKAVMEIARKKHRTWKVYTYRYI